MGCERCEAIGFTVITPTSHRFGVGSRTAAFWGGQLEPSAASPSSLGQGIGPGQGLGRLAPGN
jgi:hypothetical protein